VLPLTSTPAAVSVASQQWVFFAVDVVNTSQPLSVIMQRTSGAGDPDVYVRWNAPPTLQQYTAYEISSDLVSNPQPKRSVRPAPKCVAARG
jgi:hypothetical protein